MTGSAIRECSRLTYRLFKNVEPRYAEGSFRAFEDLKHEGTIEELAYIVRELLHVWGSREAVIEQYVAEGVDRSDIETYFNEYVMYFTEYLGPN